MSYVVRAVWNSKPGRESAVLAALRALAAETRKEAGNQLFVVYADPEAPLAFQLFELYDDADAFEAHLATAHFELYGRRAVADDLESRSRETFGLLKV